MSERCGFVGLVGPTNAGKSTLLNRLLGQKVSIVSRRPQTTLHAVRGIHSRPKSQVIFVDTPGSTQRKAQLTRLLNQTAEKHAKDCDLLVWVFDVSSRRFSSELDIAIPAIQAFKTAQERFCVLNKVDKIAKPSLLPILDRLGKEQLFTETIPLSAFSGDGVRTLLNRLHDCLPKGPLLYEVDQHTDRSQDFQITELVREKVYETMGAEIPYSIWVEVESWDRTSEVPTLYVAIHVDTQSRKRMLVGKSGRKIKDIGTRARQDIEALLGHQVCLKLFVDHHENWLKDGRSLERYLEIDS